MVGGMRHGLRGAELCWEKAFEWKAIGDGGGFEGWEWLSRIFTGKRPGRLDLDACFGWSVIGLGGYANSPIAWIIVVLGLLSFKYCFIRVVTAISAKFAGSDVILVDDRCEVKIRLSFWFRGFPSTLKTWSSVISAMQAGTSCRRFSLMARTLSEVSFEISSGSIWILLTLKSRISRRGNKNI